MDKRKLGQLEVSPIGMGCMGFSHGYGQVPPEAYAIEAIRGAYDYRSEERRVGKEGRDRWSAEH